MAENNKRNQLSGVSLSQRHMNYGNSYSFFLRKENDRVVFNADVRLCEEPYEIILEECLIEDTYFNKLLELENKCNISGYVKSFKKKPSLFQVMDKTENITSVYYSDLADRSASSGEYKDELYNFFVDLAKIYKDKSVAKTLK